MMPAFVKSFFVAVLSAFALLVMCASPVAGRDFPSNITLGSTDPLSHFDLNGLIDSRTSVSIGDVNGDGYGDLVMGVPLATGVLGGGSEERGAVYVVFGTAAGLPSSLDVSTLDGTRGFIIQGAASPFFPADPVGFHAGWSVAANGDVNGDGYDDILIGMPNWRAVGITKAGMSLVFYGRGGTFAPTVTIDPSLAQQAGFAKIIGDCTSHDECGTSVAYAGDFNGDGRDDILIGAPFHNLVGGLQKFGAARLIFGSATVPLPESPHNTAQGVRIQRVGASDGSEFGRSVAAAGDVDGDGFDDLIIGAPKETANGRSQSGRAFVVFGMSQADIAACVNTENELINNQFNNCAARSSIWIDGANAGDEAGTSVAGAGDINGDGFDDLIIGAPNATAPGGLLGKPGAGQIYVVFGKASPTDFDLASIKSGGGLTVDGFLFNGVTSGDHLGTAVAGPGDLNNDGIDDIVFGAPFADGTTSDFGAVYAIFGTKGSFADRLGINFLNGNTGFKVTGAGSLFRLGQSLAGGGDVNKDGIADLAMGSLSGGHGYVLYGGPPNHAPTPKDDDFSVDANLMLSGAGINLVTNDNGHGKDSDPDGDPVSIFSVATHNPNNATFVLPSGALLRGDSAGNIFYDPNGVYDALGPGSSAIDSFQYQIKDTPAGLPANFAKTGSATVRITVAGVNDPPAGSVLISGTAVVGLTLVADASGLTDPDGLGTFSYQWKRDGSAISGATTSSYTLASADQGKAVSVTVSYTDGGGTAQSVTSDPTAPVQGGFTLSVTKSGLGSGTLDSAPAGISCGSTCSALFAAGTSVTLTPAAAAGSAFAAWSGACSGPGACVVVMDQDRSVDARFELSSPGATTLFSSVLPAARSGFVGGGAITVFGSVINAGSNGAQNCQVSIPGSAPVSLSYQPTNAANVPNGTADSMFDLAPGETRSFIYAFTPLSTSTGVEVFPNTVCDNASVAAIPGVNTVFLSIADHAVPDILSIGATPSGDGIITVPAGSISFMSVSATNIGAGDSAGSANASITVTADDGGAGLPLLVQVCETDSAGTCISPLGTGPVTSNIGSGASFFAVFVSDLASGGIPLDPAGKRIFLRFKDSSGVTRSVTSAAVTVP